MRAKACHSVHDLAGEGDAAETLVFAVSPMTV